METYIGMVTSDWSQCLSPSGPFDAFVFHHPHIEEALLRILKCYTSNEISLGQAFGQVKEVLPAPLTAQQMDSYLEARFEVYKGVGELIRWCAAKRILFMINTTGFMGYFQRLLAKKLLPPFAALSGQSMLRYGSGPDDPRQMVDLYEIEDKPVNSAAVAERFNIPTGKIVVIGDSGGDGPHFNWGAKIGATLVGSMPKPSLIKYCHSKGVEINHLVGHTYAQGEAISVKKEQEFDFATLSEIIGPIMGVR